jgi:transposase
MRADVPRIAVSMLRRFMMSSPRQNSTGGKTRLGGITKRGNRYLRRLLINGASANLLR